MRMLHNIISSSSKYTKTWVLPLMAVESSSSWTRCSSQWSLLWGGSTETSNSSLQTACSSRHPAPSVHMFSFLLSYLISPTHGTFYISNCFLVICMMSKSLHTVEFHARCSVVLSLPEGKFCLVSSIFSPATWVFLTWEVTGSLCVAFRCCHVNNKAHIKQDVV